MPINYNELSDSELCKRCDEPEAFAVLSSRYLGLVNSKVASVKSSWSLDDEDLRQEAMIGLFKAASTYDDTRGVTFGAYAGVVILNRLKNEVRSHLSRKNVSLSDTVSLDELSADESQFADTPEALIEDRERVLTVLNQIHISLSDFEKKVLALYLSGYKRSQTAKILGITTRQFDNALQRVRKKLKGKDFSK
jgi:RNA polymerase sporulation-specific sigma factor